MQASIRVTAITQVRAAAACVAAVALTLAAAAPARAFATNNFTAATQVKADTEAGGGHPTLTLRMVKTPNNCPALVLFGNCGHFVPSGVPIFPVVLWHSDPIYLEQDPKKWSIDFPEGLMADPQATPKCNDPQKDPDVGFTYVCPAESKIGELVGKTRGCSPTYCTNEDSLPIKGAIYNGVPGPGEQGHLYTLIGTPEPDGAFSQWVRIDTSIVVNPATFQIEAVTDKIPDYLEFPGGAKIPIQPYDIAMTLWGNTGATSGHPLLSNATFCAPRKLESTLQGYSDYAYLDDEGTVHIGTGEGEITTNELDYPVSGCDSLPYNPKLSLSLSSSATGAAPAIDTTIEQADGEQTTKSVSLRIPKVFKINSRATVTPCAAEQLAADSCPAASQVGSGEANSRLLPDGPLAGKVTMGAADGGSFPLHVALKGFVDVAVNGSVGIDGDGDLVATFDNLPPAPISSFKMHLDGGVTRGLLLNPNRCGNATVSATFTSHQGQQVTRDVPLHISCGDVVFKARLGKLRKGKTPRLTLSTAATGIDGLTYRLPNSLAPLARKVRKGQQLGSAIFKLAGETKQTKLLLAGRRGRRVSLKATANGETVADLSLSQPRSIARKRSSKRGGRSRKGSAFALVFGDLPTGTVTVELTLGGNKRRALSMPPKCGQSLRFSMDASDPDGAPHTATRKVKVKCAGKQAKRHHSHGKGKEVRQM